MCIRILNHFFKEYGEPLRGQYVAPGPELPYYEGLPSIHTQRENFHALRTQKKTSQDRHAQAQETPAEKPAQEEEIARRSPAIHHQPAKVRS
jgi:hypothetical protein